VIFICGIAGIIPLSNEITKEQILEITKIFALENITRGRDATGIASWDVEKGDILICKQAEDAKEFVSNLKVDHIWGPTIVHNRAKTRGEPEDPENNHPMFGKKYCIIHNGTVHSMKNIDDYLYKGQCDTEVLLSYIETYGIKEAIPKIDGSAAFAIMSPDDKMFYLYKHTSPLVVAYYPGKAFAFCSTEFALKKITDILGVEKVWGIFKNYTTEDLVEGQLFSMNMKTFDTTIEQIEVSNKPIYNYYNK